MKRGGRKIIGAFVGLLVLSGTFSAKADAIVMVNFFSGLSPDPVNIVVGEAVYWLEGDGFGPYTIYGFGSPFETPGGIQFLQPGSYEYFDDLGDFGTVNVSPNLPPSVTITNPAPNTVFTAPATFEFAADASDSDLGILDVEFYVGTTLVDDIFFEPYTTTITNLPAGNYVLTVIAYDNADARATNSINISVQTGTPIQLTVPMIVAGKFLFNATGLTVGKTNVLLSSTNLASSVTWSPIATNVATSDSANFTNTLTTGRRFFRLLQLP